ncbi:hypothetical protein CHARACLAT_012388 [Characodon lateralis]|uniref:Uncharacterized protein n=1 Tax=Characodon lateralis TaxID=208331 RepID=A0ABU7F2E9_9TELE|nr:hypothetical protein [Characodon lateralis]
MWIHTPDQDEESCVSSCSLIVLSRSDVHESGGSQETVRCFGLLLLGALFLCILIGGRLGTLSNQTTSIPRLRVKVYNGDKILPLLIAALFNTRLQSQEHLDQCSD